MAVKRITDGHPDGIQIGAAADLLGFFGATPRVQVTTFSSIGTTATTAILKARINSIRTGLRALGIVA